MLQALLYAASRDLVRLFGSVHVMAENCLISICALSASVFNCYVLHGNLLTSLHHATICWLTFVTEIVRCSLVHDTPCIRQPGCLPSVCRTSRGRTPYKLSHPRLQWRRRQGRSCEAHQAVTVFLTTLIAEQLFDLLLCLWLQEERHGEPGSCRGPSTCQFA